MTIEILLADDQCLMLEGIKAILKHEPEIKVIGTALDGQSAIAQVKNLQPDIVLMDIEMPKMDGIAATKYICDYLPDTRVIVLTSHDDRDYITKALEAGASGYLLKESLLEDLKRAIYSLGRGYSYIEAKLLIQAINKIQKTNVVKYQERITYLRKYRKSIYNPVVDTSTSSSFSASSARKFSSKIGKTSLAPIFQPTRVDVAKLSANSASNDLKPRLKKLQRRGVVRKILWLLIAISSLILSIVLF